LAAELRWILLGLSLPLLAFIWWWTARRAGQSPGDPALRESSAGKTAAGKAAVGKPAENAPPLDPRYIDDDEEMKPEPASRDWGVPPFEPLNIRTADFDRVPVLDGPMMVNPHPQPAAAGIPAQVPTMRAGVTAGPVTDHSDRFAAVAPPTAGAAELQRIVTIRVCALGEARWSGAQLTAALELHGLAFGRYQVFHRNHVDGRSLFCVASLIEPGTFDLAGMADQEFRGVTLFAVLPGPIAPLETMDELFATARGLAEELSGMVQDAKGIPLSPQRAAALREDVARFQALLPGN
jgi:cell division protein ZipA